MESTGLALPPLSLFYHLQARIEFWGKEPFVSSIVELCSCSNCAASAPANFAFSMCGAHSPSTYAVSVSLMFFPPPFCLPQPPPSLPHSTRASVEVLSRVCREIQTDRRVKRVSCRAAAAAAEALLLRGCDLDNQEELERLQALEPLQLQQCQEGVSCVTQCPI